MTFVQKPSPGRVVHYVARGSLDGAFSPACRAATITEVGGVSNVPGTVIPSDDHYVGLAVLNPTGMFFHSLAAGGCLYDEGAGRSDSNMCDGNRHAPGSWHWPART